MRRIGKGAGSFVLRALFKEIIVEFEGEVCIEPRTQ